MLLYITYFYLCAIKFVYLVTYLYEFMSKFSDIVYYTNFWYLYMVWVGVCFAFFLYFI